MIDLRHEVEAQGYKVIHIKTDSIKIENPDDYILDFICKYGKRHGYDFEVEHIFDRICLVNNAVYVAKLADDDPENPGTWTATGTQFQIPYVFKSLFSKEDIKFEDMCETKSVSGSLYLDLNEDLPDVSQYEKEFSKAESDFKKGLLSDTTFESTCQRLNPLIAKGHNYRFIGKVGQFCPIKTDVVADYLCVRKTISIMPQQVQRDIDGWNLRWSENLIKLMTLTGLTMTNL